MKKLFLIFFLICTPVYADGIDANTVLMMHCDGADEGTTFTDDSDSSITLTGNNQAKTDDAQKQFGTTACYFDGTTDYVSGPDTAALEVGTGAITIDAWVYMCAAGSSSWNSGVISYYLDSNNYYNVVLNAIGAGVGLRFQTKVGGTYDASGDSSYTFTTEWKHIAAVKQSGSVTGDIFFDGVLQDNDSSNNVHVGDLSFAGATLYVGAVNSTTDDFCGWIDELRISDVDRYDNGTGFTPESTAYSAASSTSIIMISGKPFLDKGQMYSKKFNKRKDSGFDRVFYNYSHKDVKVCDYIDCST